MNFFRVKEKYNNMSLPVKAALWYTLCNVINKGIALVSTPIFTRILTEEQYGTFAIFQSWFSILIIFTSLNVFQGGYQKGLILYKKDEMNFTSSQLGLTTIITAIWFIIYILKIDFWTNVFELPINLMLAMFIELLFIPALELWSSQQIFNYKYKKYVFLTIAMSVFSLGGGVIAVLYSSEKLEARVYTDVLSKALFAGALFILIFKSGKCFFSRQYWKFALLFNLPLIPHYLSTFILNQSDRVMIGRMVGNSQAAYYSVAYTISTMMILITGAINNSLTPYIYRALEKNNEKSIKDATKPILILVAALCFITMAFSPEAIRIFGGEKYLEAIYVIPPIAASVFFIFLYTLFSNIEFYFQKTRFIALATGISAIVNLILNFIFIKIYGYYAAGYTTLVCYICLAVLHYIFYRKVLKEENMKNNVYDMKMICLMSFIVIIGMTVFAVTYRYIFIRYAILASILIITLIFRNKIKSLLLEFRKMKKNS